MPLAPDPHLWAIVMAGGSGTRFWPASRRARPKQFLRVAGERTLLQSTVDRLAPLVGPERVLVIGAAAHTPTVRAQLPEVPAANILGEPCARGTLPCAAWAAAEVARRDPEATLALLPADHVIAPVESFRSALARAARVARAEPLPVVFGVRPTHPATGFGWIELGAASGEARALVRFVEKPDAARARAFLAAGNFVWNGGVFVWTAATLAALLRTHAPEFSAPFVFGHPDPAAFAALPDRSIDVGLMEHVAAARVIEADFTWSDVGSWSALPEVLPTDLQGNCTAGGAELIAIDARDNVVHGPAGSLTALIGVERLVVARDGDAVLVARLDRAQDVRAVIQALELRAPAQL